MHGREGSTMFCLLFPSRSTSCPPARKQDGLWWRKRTPRTKKRPSESLKVMRIIWQRARTPKIAKLVPKAAKAMNSTWISWKESWTAQPNLRLAGRRFWPRRRRRLLRPKSYPPRDSCSRPRCFCGEKYSNWHGCGWLGLFFRKFDPFFNLI